MSVFSNVIFWTISKWLTCYQFHCIIPHEWLILRQKVLQEYQAMLCFLKVASWSIQPFAHLISSTKCHHNQEEWTQLLPSCIWWYQELMSQFVHELSSFCFAWTPNLPEIWIYLRHYWLFLLLRSRLLFWFLPIQTYLRVYDRKTRQLPFLYMKLHILNHQH